MKSPKKNDGMSYADFFGQDVNQIGTAKAAQKTPEQANIEEYARRAILQALPPIVSPDSYTPNITKLERENNIALAKSASTPNIAGQDPVELGIPGFEQFDTDLKLGENKFKSTVDLILEKDEKLRRLRAEESYKRMLSEAGFAGEDMFAEEELEKRMKEAEDAERRKPGTVNEGDLKNYLGEDEYNFYADAKRSAQEKEKELWKGRFSFVEGAINDEYRVTEKNPDLWEWFDDAAAGLWNAGVGLVGVGMGLFVATGNEISNRLTGKGRGLTDEQYEELERERKIIEDYEAPMNDLRNKEGKDLEVEFDKKFKKEKDSLGKGLGKAFSFATGSLATAYLFDDDYDHIKYMYSEAQNEYDHAKGEKWYPGFFEDRIGWLSVPMNMRGAAITKKLEKVGEEGLEPIEIEYLKALQVYNTAKYGGINTKLGYEVGKTVRTSGEMMVDLLATRGATGLASKALIGTKGTVLGFRVGQYSGKIAQTTAFDLAASPLGMSMTWNEAAKGYMENVTAVTGVDGQVKFLASDEQKYKEAMVIEDTIKTLEHEMSSLLNSRDEDELNEDELSEIEAYKQDLHFLKSNLRMLKNDKGELVNPYKTAFENLKEGYAGSFVENFTEKVGGPLIDKGLGAVGRGLSHNFVGRAVGKSRPGRALQDLNIKATQFGRKIDKKMNISDSQLGSYYRTHLKRSGLLQSLPAEVGEEIMANLIPTYGEDYAEGLEELTTAKFYILTLASTGLMNGFSTGAGGAMHLNSMLKNAEYRKTYNENKGRRAGVRAILDQIDGSLDSEVANLILQNIVGTAYSAADVKKSIAQLRDPNFDLLGIPQDSQNRVADYLEQNNFTKLAMDAISTGTENNLKNSLKFQLRKELAKKSQTPESQTKIKNLQNAIKEISDLRQLAIKTESDADQNSTFPAEVARYLNQRGLEQVTDFRDTQFLPGLEQEVSGFNELREKDGKQTYTVQELIEGLESNLESQTNTSEGQIFSDYVAEFFQHSDKSPEIARKGAREKLDARQTVVDSFNRNAGGNVFNVSTPVREDYADLTDSEFKAFADAIEESDSKVAEKFEKENSGTRNKNTSFPGFMEATRTIVDLKSEIKAADKLLEGLRDVEGRKKALERRKKAMRKSLLAKVDKDNIEEIEKMAKELGLLDSEFSALLKQKVIDQTSGVQPTEEDAEEVLDNASDFVLPEDLEAPGGDDGDVTEIKKKNIFGRLRDFFTKNLKNEVDGYAKHLAILDKDLSSKKTKRSSKKGSSEWITTYTVDGVDRSKTGETAKEAEDKATEDIQEYHELVRVALEFRKGKYISLKYDWDLMQLIRSFIYANENRGDYTIRREETLAIIDDIESGKTTFSEAVDKLNEEAEKYLKAENDEGLFYNKLVLLELDIYREKNIKTKDSKEKEKENKEKEAKDKKERELSKAKARARLKVNKLVTELNLALRALEKAQTLSNITTALSKIKEIRDLKDDWNSVEQHVLDALVLAEKKINDLSKSKENKPAEKPEETPADNEVGPNELDNPEAEAPLVSNIDLDALFSPEEFDESDARHKEIFEFFKARIADATKKQPKMQFRGLVTGLYNSASFGAHNLDTYFKILYEAWAEVKGEKLSESQLKDIYNEFYLAEEVLEDFTLPGNLVSSTPSTTTPEITQNTSDAKGKLESSESDRKEVDPLTGKNTEITFTEHTKKKFRGLGLKLGGVLGLLYKEDEYGNKIDKSKQVNEDAIPFMDVRNFKPGDEVEMVFNIDYLLDPENVLSKWSNLDAENKTPSDKRPTKSTVKVRDMLIEVFKNTPGLSTWAEIEAALEDYKENKNTDNPLFKNEEFLKMVPIGTINKGYTEGTPEKPIEDGDILFGGLNDYYWFNNSNVALKENEEGFPLLGERKRRIEDNRKMNLDARKAILAGGSIKLKVSEKRDATNNYREDLTEAQIEAGMVPEFNSLFDEFGSVEDFLKNAALGIHIGGDLIGASENGRDKSPLKIDGKEVPLDQISNYEDFMIDGKKRKLPASRPILVHKAGFDSNGKQLYLIHNVNNQHENVEKQKEFTRTANMAYSMRVKLLDQSNDTPTERVKKKEMRAKFKAQFGYDITEHTRDVIAESYPEATTSGKTYSEPGKIGNYAMFRQDFKHKSARRRSGADAKYNMIPDLRQYDSIEQFLEALHSGEQIHKVDKLEIVTSNIDTNLVFTKIENKGESVFTISAQPTMMFEGLGPSAKPNIEVSDEKDQTIVDARIDRLQKKRESLEKAKAEVESERSKLELQEEIDSVNEVLEKLDSKTDEQNELDLQDVEIQSAMADSTLTNGLKEDLRVLEEMKNEALKDAKEEDKDAIRKQYNDEALVLIHNEEKFSETFDIVQDTFSDADLDDAVGEVVRRAMIKVDLDGSITPEYLIDLIEKEFESIVAELRESGLDAEADFMEENSDAILGESVYDGSAKEFLDALLNVENLEELMEFSGENVKESGKASYEIDILQSLSFKVKILLSSVEDSRATEGFAGFKPAMPLSDVFSGLQQILSEANTNTLEAAVALMEAKIERNPTEFGFYKDVIKKLNYIDSKNKDIMREIMYNLYQTKVDMKFVMWKRDEQGVLKASVLDANVKNPLFRKRDRWVENLKRSELIEIYDNDFYRINEKALDAAEILLDKIVADYEKGLGTTKGASINDVDRKDLEKYLNMFGIKLLPKHLDNIFDGKEPQTVKTLLGGQGQSLLNVLFNNLVTVEDSPEEKFTLNPTSPQGSGARVLNPLLNRNSQILDLIKADNFLEFIPATNIYVGGKPVNVVQQHNAISKKIDNLKEALEEWIETSDKAHKDGVELSDADLPTYLKKFKDSKITSNSMLLGMIERNPKEALDYLDTFMSSLEVLKEAGSKSRTDMTITELSEKDEMVTKLGFFAKSEGKLHDTIFGDETDNKISLRKGYMNFPTISDSSQLPWLKTFLMELTDDNVDTETGILEGTLYEIMKSQFLEGDLLRIADYLVKSGKKKSNIKGYHAGAQWITGMPSLNAVEIEDENGNTRSLKFAFTTMVESDEFKEGLLDDKGQPVANYDSLLSDKIKEFMDTHNSAIKEGIEKNINSEVDKLISPDLTRGKFVDYDLIHKDKLKLSDGKNGGYFGSKSARLVAYDYVINYMIQQKDIQTIFAGDVALYFSPKMDKDLVNGMPKVELNDVMDFYYNSIEDAKVFKEIVGKTPLNKLTEEQQIQLIEAFPKTKFVDGIFVSDTVDPEFGADYEEAYKEMIPVASYKVAQMFKDVQNNLSKRLQAQLSPGNIFPKAKFSPNYHQIIVKDTNTASNTFLDLVEVHYPGKSAEVEGLLAEHTALESKYNRTIQEESEFKAVKNKIEELVPKVAPFLDAATSDGQEYSTWKENLEQLRDQGRITDENFEKLKVKLQNQSDILARGESLTDADRLTPSETKLIMMQATKPLYAGMVSENANGHNVNRFVYVKSSSIPLLPEMTEGWAKLDNLRKNVEDMQRSDVFGGNIRVAFESAVKVGGVSNAIDIRDLYQKSVDMDKVKTSSVELERENFSIQQDKPFKGDINAEKGRKDKTSRATQFEKIILGDGINKIEDYVFPSEMFDASLLKELGIKVKKGNINGPSLGKLYKELYKREQKILTDKMFKDLNMSDYSDIANGKVDTMRKLAKIFNKRLNSKQDKKALELMYQLKDGSIVSERELKTGNHKPVRAMFKTPLFLTPNSRKFESVFNSLTNKNNINLKYPGYAMPLASQEGFDYKNFSEEEFLEWEKRGMIVTEAFDPKEGLKSTRTVDGKLEYSQVFMPNKFKLFNSETGKYETVDLKEYLKEGSNILDLDKFPKDLLSMFSFRIPTSSHQSGAVIEIVGFLPANMADTVIISKDQTVQIGEDFDIDVRYAYQYNYFKDATGKIRKVSYDDVNRGDLKTLKEEHSKAVQEVYDAHFVTGENESGEKVYAPEADNFMQIVNLQYILDNWDESDINIQTIKEVYEIDGEVSQRVVKKLIEGLREENTSKFLHKNAKIDLEAKNREIEANVMAAAIKNSAILNYFKIKEQEDVELSAIENNTLSIYKSIYSSVDEGVRSLISTALSTDFSRTSAERIDKRVTKSSDIFNIYSPETQSHVMKSGASGQMAIGSHSNSVTQTSILQQLKDPLQFYNYTTEDGVRVPYNIILGGNKFDGILGKIHDGDFRVSSSLMESQNSATDNQKLEIMNKRNENAETIAVFGLLQQSGLEHEGLDIFGEEISYASLFISQPIIQEFAALTKANKSSVDKVYGKPHEEAIKLLKEKYEKDVNPNLWRLDKNGQPEYGILGPSARDLLGSEITSEFLHESLRNPGDTENLSIDHQFYILETFARLIGPAEQWGKLQKFTNIESGGLGISYFNVIDMKDQIIGLQELSIVSSKAINTHPTHLDYDRTGFSEMFGRSGFFTDAEIEDRKSEGYVFISKEGDNYNLMLKPDNHFAHKIANSIALGYNLGNSLFPYDHPYIKNQVDTIVSQARLDGSATDLKYDIISSMKDFAYLNSRTLFGGDVVGVSQKLFFDSKDPANPKESLGGYMMRLQGDPQFSEMFNQPFFRDLQIRFNDRTSPTIIEHNSGDTSKINDRIRYNMLNKMSNSSKALPNKADGTPMTEALLMKELLMYSLISSQENGAIGFRHVLPMELFDKYGVNKVLRENTQYASNEIKDTAYAGPAKSLERFFGQQFDERGILKVGLPYQDEVQDRVDTLNSIIESKTGESNVFEVLEDGSIYYTLHEGNFLNDLFVKQYFQHNPDKVKKTVTGYDLDQLLKDNQVSSEAFYMGRLNSFASTNLSEDFVTLKDSSGKIYLYEKVDHLEADRGSSKNYNQYNRIPILGSFGFNEYNSNKEVKKSMVASNNEGMEWQNDLLAPEVVTSAIENIDLQGIIDSVINDYNNPYSGLMSALNKFIPNIEDVQIRVAPSLKGRAVYKTVDGKPVIEISAKFLNKAGLDSQDFYDAIVEEILHHVTKTEISKYITITGIKGGKITYDLVNPEVPLPSELQSLISVYNYAITYYAKKHGNQNLMDMINEQTRILNSENESITVKAGIEEDAYRLRNMDEFLAGIFIRNKAFAEEMGETPYRASGKSVLAKFSESLIKFFKRILPKAKKDSVSAHATAELFKFLNAEFKNRPKKDNVKKKKGKSPEDDRQTLEDIQREADREEAALRAKEAEEKRKRDLKNSGGGKPGYTTVIFENNGIKETLYVKGLDIIDENGNLRFTEASKYTNQVFAKAAVIQGTATIVEADNGKTYYVSQNGGVMDPAEWSRITGESNKELIEELKNKADKIFNKDANKKEPFYTGLIEPEPDTVFVFGSNPLGINGNPKKYPNMSASVAVSKFGVEQGEKMNNVMSNSGSAYGLTTVTGPGKKRSMTPAQITENVRKLYQTAKENPSKDFKIAYTNTSKTTNNGYTGYEMVQMFLDAGERPANVIFSEQWHKIEKSFNKESDKAEKDLGFKDGPVSAADLSPNYAEDYNSYKEASKDAGKDVDLTKEEFDSLTQAEQETIIEQVKNC